MSEHRAHQAKKITIIGAIVNLLQGLIKILGGLWFNSHALIADGFHSFSDLITDFMVFFGAHYGNQAADETHPYGHQRIETATTLFLSLLLILAGAGIGWHAYEALANKVLTPPTYGALIVAGLSILSNELVFYFTLRTGNRIQSDLIKANAWHSRADSASSLVVAVGVLGSMMGYTYLDAFAAIVVALLIIKMGIEYVWTSLKELVDTAVDPELTREIEKIITSVPGVNKIHQLRTRSMGQHVLVDVHILVFPYLTVSEGHFIAQHVHQALLKHLPIIQDVTVHVDPEDDELFPPSVHLPNRKIIEETWLVPLQKTFPNIQTWGLHYLSGKLSIDLYISPTDQNLSHVHEHCQSMFAKTPYIKTIRIFTLTHEFNL
jgi:cation diffusion facilitator family transporter